MLPLADACRATAARCPSFSDAAALLRAWARQQQLTTGADGLSGCLLTLLLVHTVESSPMVSAHTAGLFSSIGGMQTSGLNACICTGCQLLHWGAGTSFRMRKDNLIPRDPTPLCLIG
jgi:hypothetical protein